MIDNFVPVIKFRQDKENQKNGNDARECRGCKKRKASREFHRDWWTNDQGRETYRRTCQDCRGLPLRPPAVGQPTAAELAPPGEKAISGLLGTLSRQVFLDLTNDPSRLIRERIFDHLRLSSLVDSDHSSPSSLGSHSLSRADAWGTENRELGGPQTAAKEDRQRTEDLEQRSENQKEESLGSEPPTRPYNTSECVSDISSPGCDARSTGTRNLPKLERPIHNQLWPATPTFSFRMVVGADQRSNDGLDDPTCPKGSTRIPRRSRFKSEP
ncbi:hypothetical protein PGTUg99_018091 [Puccinia graminis f. sp. tritici]|uniref:Uncharacterized protein n=1 Tax=Puccinia graminis f. sp. tritici TaxID=56615 RepID=A0A5B0RN07_PUCGR|nr:hypothetical protein PGTUg99_018091 [Puccinia graminis f. sp. tritici]